ncbi:MAG: hypothetical protein CTY12_01925 [Methylotenera sp.]|nr:MAG: hypothetical protein CTY12_01925 [Methylotenera sp.]
MRIGIFFVVDGALISDSIPVEQGQCYGDHVEHGAHYDYWLNLVPNTVAESLFKSHAYDYYPRGRAVFDVTHHQVKLYVDRCIDTAALSTIRASFLIPDNTRVSYDEHYQCHHCNQMFVDDFDETDE